MVGSVYYYVPGIIRMGSTGRIEIDVGGTKFLTAASTLMSNSTYFASYFSENWSKSSDAKKVRRITLSHSRVTISSGGDLSTKCRVQLYSRPLVQSKGNY